MDSLQRCSNDVKLFETALSVLLHPEIDETIKLEISRILHGSLQLILGNSSYADYVVDLYIKSIIQFFADRKPSFILENSSQILSEALLKLTCDIPSYFLKPHFTNLFSLLCRFFQMDNEELCLLGFKIIKKNWENMDLSFSSDIWILVRQIVLAYKDLNMDKICQTSPDTYYILPEVEDISDVCVQTLQNRIYARVQIEFYTSRVTLLPKSCRSLRVLTEAPKIILLFCKNKPPKKDIEVMLRTLVEFINLNPDQNLRKIANFSGYYIDFLIVQTNVLEFLYHIYMINEDSIIAYSPQTVSGFVNLLKNCSSNAVYLQYALLQTLENLIKTKLKKYFVPWINDILINDLLTYKGSTSLKHLRAFSFSVFLNLTEAIYDLLPNEERAEKLQEATTEFWLHKICEPDLPIKTQIHLCDIILKLAGSFCTNSSLSKSMKSNLLLEICKQFILKVKLLSRINLPDTIYDQCTKSSKGALCINSVRDSEHGYTLKDTECFNIISFLQSCESEKHYEPYESTEYPISEYIDLINIIIDGIHYVHKTLFIEKSGPYSLAPEAWPLFLVPLHITLLKKCLRAMNLFNYPSWVEDEKASDFERNFQKIAEILSFLPRASFRKVFAECIDELLGLASLNASIRIFVRKLLFHRDYISQEMTTLLLNYLLDHLEDMGGNSEMCASYLPIFEDLLQALYETPYRTEEIFKIYVLEIFKKCCEVILCAREGVFIYNILKLMSAIFVVLKTRKLQSISHILLPHIPQLLDSLNLWYRNAHNLELQEKIVETCLIIPKSFNVREIMIFFKNFLPSLLNALDANSNLILQGLQTLDEMMGILDFAFLNRQLEKHESSLFQRLCSAARNESVDINHLAVKLLGKLSAGNRFHGKLNYNSDAPSVIANVRESANHFIQFPIEKIMKSALNAATCKGSVNFNWQHCWSIVKYCLTAYINLDVDVNAVTKRINSPRTQESRWNKCHLLADWKSRKTHKLVLMGMLACGTSCINSEVKDFMDLFIEQNTFVAISDEFGTDSLKAGSLDSCILIDAIMDFVTFEYNSSKFEIGIGALKTIISSAHSTLTKEKAWDCHYIQYMVNKINLLCYKETWYSKYFACKAIKLILEQAPYNWIYTNLPNIVDSLLFIVGDLETSLNGGIIHVPCTVLEASFVMFYKVENHDKNEVSNLQFKALKEITEVLFRHLTSPKENVRKQVMWCLQLLATRSFLGLEKLMEPMNDIFSTHTHTHTHSYSFLNELQSMKALCPKLGFLDGFVFCMSLGLPFDSDKPYDDFLLQKLFHICNQLRFLKIKSSNAFKDELKLYQTSLRALCSIFLRAEGEISIIHVVNEAMESSVPEISSTAFECMKYIAETIQLKSYMVKEHIYPLFATFQDLEVLKMDEICHLNYLFKAFKNILEVEIQEKIVDQLNKSLDVCLTASTNYLDGYQIKEFIKNKFYWVPNATYEIFRKLFEIIVKLDADFDIDFRKLVLLLFQESPHIYFNLLFSTNWTHVERFQNLFTLLLKNKTGEPLRKGLLRNISKLKSVLKDELQHRDVNIENSSQELIWTNLNPTQSCIIKIIYYLNKQDSKFLMDSHELVSLLWDIWRSDDFQANHFVSKTYDYKNFKLYKWLAKCLLEYIKYHVYEVEILFDLLRPLNSYLSQHFKFITEFLLHTVSEKYGVKWKRHVFLYFINIFHKDKYTLSMKTKFLQFIIIPSFAASFHRGEIDEIVFPNEINAQSSNLAYVLIERTIGYCCHVTKSDVMKILLLQFSCILVKYASHHLFPGCCSYGCLLKKLLLFAEFCIRVGTRSHNLVLKCHGNLLISYISEYTKRDSNSDVFQVLLDFCNLYTPEVQRTAIHLLQILSKSTCFNSEQSFNLKLWIEKVLPGNSDVVPQCIHIFNMVKCQPKIFNLEHKDVIQDLISMANLLAFQNSLSHENKELLFQITEILLKRIKSMEKNQWVNTQLAHSQNKDIPFEENGDLFATLYDSRCFGSHVCMVYRVISQKSRQTSNSLHEITMDCDNIIKDLFDFVDNDDKSPVEEPMDFRSNSILENTAEKVLGYLSKFFSTTCAASFAKHQKNIALSVLNFLLKLACKDFNTEKYCEQVFSIKCMDLLKSSLLLHPFDQLHFDLKWWFNDIAIKKDEQDYANVSICLEFEVLLHLILTKLKAKEDFIINLIVLFRDMIPFFSCHNRAVIRFGENLLNLLKLINYSIEIKAAHTYENAVTDLFNILQYFIHAVFQSSFTDRNDISTQELLVIKDMVMVFPKYINEIPFKSINFLLNITQEQLKSVNCQEEKATMIWLLNILEVGSTVSTLQNIIYILQDLSNKSHRDVLLEVVKITKKLIVEKNTTQLDPFSLQICSLLNTIFQRINVDFKGCFHLHLHYFDIIQHMYRNNFCYRLERFTYLDYFNAGLRCKEYLIHKNFFDILNQHVAPNFESRIKYLVDQSNMANVPFSLNFYVALIVTSCFEVNVKDAHQIGLCESNQTVLPSTSGIKMTDVESTNIVATTLFKHNPSLQNLYLMKKSFCDAVVALCYENVSLAGYLWTHLFPKLWNLFGKEVKNFVGEQLQMILTSYVESYQGSKWPMPLVEFTEGVLNCMSPSPLNPAFHKYFGSLYNMWQRSSMLFSYEDNAYLQNKKTIKCDVCLELLSEAYSSMEEEYLWYGLWKKYGKYPETVNAIMNEEKGYFHQACEMYQNAMIKYTNNFSDNKHLHIESNVWPNHWIRSVKELGQWNFSNTSILSGDGSSVSKHSLIIQKELPEICLCKSLKITLLNLMVRQNYGEELFNCNFVKCPMKICLEKRNSCEISEVLTEASLLLVDEWKSLPSTVSERHFSLLKAMMKIREFEEAMQFQDSLKQDENFLMQGVFSVAEKWFLRLPSLHENLSFWNEIYLFRQNQFRCLQSKFLRNTKLQTAEATTTLIYLGLFGYNQSTMEMAELYRKYGMSSLCITQLMRIKSTKVDVNAFEQCVRAFVEEVYNTCILERKVNLLHKACFYYQSAEKNLKELKIQDFIKKNSIKSDLLSALELHLDLNDDSKNILWDSSMLDVMALRLERSFISSHQKERLFNEGSLAVEYILKACKNKSETESIHSISRLLLLLFLENELGKVVAKYSNCIPESHWLPWIPQLLSILLNSKDTAISSLIKRVGKKYPQSLYIHLRALHSNVLACHFNIERKRKTCFEELLNDLKRNYPYLGFTLLQIFDQLMELKKNRCQSILRILKICEAKVHSAFFQSLKTGSDLNNLSELWSFINLHLDALESNCCSNDFKEMKKEFVEGCLNQEGLDSMITELSKWIKFYSNKILQEQRLFLPGLKNHFLSEFHLYDHEVKMFTSGFFQEKGSRIGNVRIFQFLPTVEFIEKYNDVACRFYIRGDDGNVYPYTFVSDAFIKNIGKQNNVSRFLSFLNPVLKKRETLRYFLKIDVPDIVTISSDVHIVLDDESSLSLTDIYKQHSTEVKDDPLACYYHLMLNSSEKKPDETIPYNNGSFMLDVYKFIQQNFVSERILKEWAKAVYEGPADYLEFRKQFAKDIALLGFLKNVFGLTSQNPDKIFVHQEDGHIINFGYQFQDITPDLSSSTECVPFRLTPNISELLTPAGVKGIFMPIMQATACCFQKHERLIQNLLEVFWLDDCCTDKAEPKTIEDCRENIFNNVKLIFQSTAVLAELLNNKQLESQVKSAKDPKNLCLMNPTWFPWF